MGEFIEMENKNKYTLREVRFGNLGKIVEQDGEVLRFDRLEDAQAFKNSATGLLSERGLSYDILLKGILVKQNPEGYDFSENK